MTGLILFTIFGLVATAALLLNRDIFSPAKLYMGFVCLTYFDIFIHPYSVLIVFVFLALLLVALITALVERESGVGRSFKQAATRSGRKRTVIYRSELRLLTAFFWCVSLVPLGVQLYLVLSFGGLDAYLSAMAVRHSAFRGLGTIMEISRSIAIINVVYFAFGLLGK